MDLHDFSDVALNYDNYVKQLAGDEQPLIDYHTDLCKKYGQTGIIDIACGTGVLTIPLAKAGYDVVACDLSEAMVSITKKKLEDSNLDVYVFSANMIDFKIDRKFSLAIIARSGFMHLTTPNDQRMTLLNINRHLVEKGILVLNLYNPNVKLQYKQINTKSGDYNLRCEYINNKGQTERIYNSISYDQQTQIMSGNWRFDTLDGKGIVTDSRIRPIKMRQTYKMEMIYLCELCGFNVLQVKAEENIAGGDIWIIQKVSDK